MAEVIDDALEGKRNLPLSGGKDTSEQVNQAVKDGWGVMAAL